MASLINTNNVYEGCNYYMMCRINNDEWRCFLDNPFVLHIEGRKLNGQFLSSSWFKKQIQIDDIIDLLIIRLPRRDSLILPDERVTADILINRIRECDEYNRNESYINYEMLDFVVIYKHYRRDTTKYICNILKSQITQNEVRTSVTDHGVFTPPIYSNINITFEMVKDIDTSNLTLNNVIPEHTLDIPQLSRNDGSWNTYRNSFSEDNDKYYITCPHFTFNIG